MKCAFILVKHPGCCEVKTRIARSFGDEFARSLYECFVLDILDELSTMDAKLLVALHPPEAVGNAKDFLGTRSVVPQVGECLGERLKGCFERAFSEGFDRAIVLASDVPDITSNIVEGALSLLEKYDTAVGPSLDGGYYLIGFRSGGYTPAVFEDMQWSVPTVLDETLRRLRCKGLTVRLLPPWPDVDDREGVRALALRVRKDSRTGIFLAQNGV